MTVNVKFDDRTWARLAAIADRVGSTVPELLADSAQRLIVGTSRFPQQQPARSAELTRTRIEHKQALTSQIIRLRGRGRTVRQIADLVGYSTTYVSKILCDNGHRTHQPHNERTAA